jgi:hypothetical protein
MLPWLFDHDRAASDCRNIAMIEVLMAYQNDVGLHIWHAISNRLVKRIGDDGCAIAVREAKA